jgi:tetratricopeptide (TPR) repeat protein
MSDLGEDEEQTGSYSIYFAEGEALAKQKQFQKAIESFTKALEFQPEDRPCLVERSKCHLQLGDTSAALADAEASLKEDKTYHRGLYQKAETMYAMGDFEYALVFYHRGDKIRPDIKAFKLGIQKAQEAINNSIGSPAACKLDKTGDLSFFQQQDMIGKKRVKRRAKAAATTQQKAVGERKPVASDRAVKDILGELYVDREYLSNLIKDPGLVVSGGDRSLYTTVDEALGYLDARTEFWRQQKPMYARKRERELKKYRPAPTRSRSKVVPRPTGGAGVDHTKYVLKGLEDIDSAMSGGEAESSLEKAQQLMKTVEEMSTTDLPNKREFIASIHSCMGNAYLEMGEAQLALEQHLSDLHIAEAL